MPPTKLTDRDIEFIKANRFIMCGSDIAKEIGVGQVLINLAKEEISFQKMTSDYGNGFAGKAGKFFEVKEIKELS